MLKIKENNILSSKYKIIFYLPYYNNDYNYDKDMCYPSIVIDANSKSEAMKFAQKYIKSKKTSMNSKAWRNAVVNNVTKI